VSERVSCRANVSEGFSGPLPWALSIRMAELPESTGGILSGSLIEAPGEKLPRFQTQEKKSARR
jgi:hypothetical protein